jgi:hypothetical protein
MAANAVRLQLHALAYNMANFLRTLALPADMATWSLTVLREKFVKIGAKVIAHARYTVFQMAEVAVPRDLFRRILDMIQNSATNGSRDVDTRADQCVVNADRRSAPGTRPTRANERAHGS